MEKCASPIGKSQNCSSHLIALELVNFAAILKQLVMIIQIYTSTLLHHNQCESNNWRHRYEVHLWSLYVLCQCPVSLISCAHAIFDLIFLHLDRSQPLFYFVPQDSHSQAGSTSNNHLFTIGAKVSFELFYEFYYESNDDNHLWLVLYLVPMLQAKPNQNLDSRWQAWLLAPTPSITIATLLINWTFVLTSSSTSWGWSSIIWSRY